MAFDLDIYRNANVLGKRYGRDAPIRAAMHADKMLEAGDPEGHAVWKRILRAVEELQRTEAGPGVSVQWFPHRAIWPWAPRLQRALRTKPHESKRISKLVNARARGRRCRWPIGRTIHAGPLTISWKLKTSRVSWRD